MKIKLIAKIDIEETIEVSEQDLDGMSLEDYCEQYLNDMIAGRLDTGWEIVE